MKRLTIVHLTHLLGEYGASGVVRAIAARQGAHHTVRVVSFRGGKGAESFQEQGLACDVLFPQEQHHGHVLISAALSAPRAALAVRRIGPDLVHVHLFGSGLPGSLGAWLSRVPYVGHLHTAPTPDGSTGIGPNVLRYLRVFYRRGNLISLTEDAQDAYREHGLETHVVPNSIDLTDFDERMRALPPAIADSATRRVLLVAELAPYKDPDTFLRAARAVVTDAGDGVKFYIAGDGRLREHVGRFARQLGLQDDVVLLGRREDVPALMRDCDVACLTSIQEGLPLVLLEAGAAGRACVVTDTSGGRSVICDGANGFVVPVGDDRAVATRVLQLLRDDQLRSDMGKAARKRVETNYTVEAQMSALDRVYERVLRQTCRRTPPRM